MTQAFALTRQDLDDGVIDLDQMLLVAELALCGAVDDFLEGRTDTMPLDADYAMPEGTAARMAEILMSIEAEPSPVIDILDLNDEWFKAQPV